MSAKLRPIAALLFALAALAAGAPRTAALDRGIFGWRVAEVSGTRPLLVIWIREPDAMAQDELTKYRTYYQDAVFGRIGTAPTGAPHDHLERSVLNYFREVSSGKFTWSRAGFVGPLNAHVKGQPATEVVRLAIDAAATDGGFDFRPFDVNHDGRIAAQELAILVITNAAVPQRSDAVAFADRNVMVPAQGVALAGGAAMVGENDGFATVNHHLFRLLAPEAVDIEGWPQKCFALNGGRSLLAERTAINPLIMHPDPWHKMLVGWVEPRVYDIAKPGIAQLAAHHLSSSEPALARPILLFDPKKGTREFFLLEYRALSPVGFDQADLLAGLVVWQVALDGTNRPFAVPADRPNCKGETLSVPSLFVRAPNWQLGGNTPYLPFHSPFSLKWLDGKDSGTRVTLAGDNPNRSLQWRIEVSWTVADREAEHATVAPVPPEPTLHSR
jgi:hypothetical protein